MLFEYKKGQKQLFKENLNFDNSWENYFPE